jgi:hypothetical protein
VQNGDALGPAQVAADEHDAFEERPPEKRRPRTANRQDRHSVTRLHLPGLECRRNFGDSLLVLPPTSVPTTRPIAPSERGAITVRPSGGPKDVDNRGARGGGPQRGGLGEGDMVIVQF